MNFSLINQIKKIIFQQAKKMDWNIIGLFIGSHFPIIPFWMKYFDCVHSKAWNQINLFGHFLLIILDISLDLLNVYWFILITNAFLINLKKKENSLKFSIFNFKSPSDIIIDLTVVFLINLKLFVFTFIIFSVT